ncbi:hypothetical protein [Roseateles paludis]|uniref:PLL-like beta propeller domain-containing protein n=1 Tax=Roseateles paludis TaxID=3145238 RepID=A0ABV0G627_9BURK
MQSPLSMAVAMSEKSLLSGHNADANALVRRVVAEMRTLIDAAATPGDTAPAESDPFGLRASLAAGRRLVQARAPLALPPALPVTQQLFSRPAVEVEPLLDASLQLTLTHLACRRATAGAGDDEIQLSGVLVDPLGVVTRLPLLDLGDFHAGVIKNNGGTGWALASSASNAAWGLPQRWSLVLVVNEVDNGGFPEFLADLLERLKTAIVDRVKELVSAGVATTVGGAIGSLAGGAFGALIGYILGESIGHVITLLKDWWQDDQLRPWSIAISADSPFEDRVGLEPVQFSGLGGGYAGAVEVRLNWRAAPAAMALAGAGLAVGDERLDVFTRTPGQELAQLPITLGVVRNWLRLGRFAASCPAALATPDGFELLALDPNGSFEGVQAQQGRMTGSLLVAQGANQSAAAPALVSWGGARRDVFARGADRQLWHWWSDGQGWSGPEPLGGHLVSAPAAVCWGPDRIDVFAVGFDLALWHLWWDGKAWSAWESLEGVCTSAPAACSFAADELDVFVRGGDGAMFHKRWDGRGPGLAGARHLKPGAGWSDWRTLGGEFSGAPAAAARKAAAFEIETPRTPERFALPWPSRRIDLVAPGLDGALWHNAQLAGRWLGWQSLGAPAD